jgi:predicted amidophosphoribosyltransferase
VQSPPSNFHGAHRQLLRATNTIDHAADVKHLAIVVIPLNRLKKSERKFPPVESLWEHLHLVEDNNWFASLDELFALV